MLIQVSAEARDVRLCWVQRIECGAVLQLWEGTTLLGSLHKTPVWAVGESWKLFCFCQNHI